MGLDIYDAMKAAGAGLAAIDEDQKTNAKAKLLKDLEDKKMQADEQKEKRKQDFELSQVEGERIVTKEGGLLYKQAYNSQGKPLSETPLDPYEQEKITRDVAKENLNLESILARIGSSEAAAKNSRLNAVLTSMRIGSFDREKSLQEDNLLARTEAARAATERARVSMAKDAPDQSLGALTNALIAGTKDLARQYVTTPTFTGELTEAEYRIVAQSVMKDSFKYPEGSRPDPVVSMRQAIANYIDLKAKREANKKKSKTD